ncbi:hypothetical protein TGMAS_297350 [Toxoplasma gondii MAS]|uniref:Uncharacterized protein n=2 Tax=Toxoplasma gondii TaxID=5811 RepID=A0A086PHD6_TOXGO|nr:hypothetical protein TGMAS_297350 [Toxoplasma gondii MAS]PUA84707.1 hypothetical protein TGBR9_297350 [Toxoplasma gondii TgCATBr9]
MHTIVVFTLSVIWVLRARSAVGNEAGIWRALTEGTRAAVLLSVPEDQAEPSDAAVPHRTEVSEDNYKPPVPLPEKQQSVIHRIHCCREPHCCDVEKMVVESKLSHCKPQRSSAVHRPSTQEKRANVSYEAAAETRRPPLLWLSHRQKLSPVWLRRYVTIRSVHHISMRVDHYCFHQEVIALEHELGQVEKVNAHIEKDEADFNEELLKRRENEADEAEADLSNLKAERHKIAEAIDKNVKEIDEEEKRADLEVELARMRAEGSVGKNAEEEIQNKLEALERESKIAAEEAAKEELRQRVSEMSAHANENVKRGRNILKAADESTRAFPTRHPNIAAAEQASLDSIHDAETADTIAQHDVEVEEEQQETLSSATTEAPAEREQNFEEAPEGEFPTLSTSTVSVMDGSLHGQVRCFLVCTQLRHFPCLYKCRPAVTASAPPA